LLPKCRNRRLQMATCRRKTLVFKPFPHEPSHPPPVPQPGAGTNIATAAL
jgi:hypothetical protein